ncbi:hypothetical protein [Desulfitobacterium sp.]|uniref:hypothetical protein n=1 Tax=Desulfitobacterium sp. TaxID=49981 RepID=UPI002B699B23|nr:hypothetical protein [Desulfitobacterium sp.]HVJ48983.1 hypothetical protein [Desulfitobacterium sp.]
MNNIEKKTKIIIYLLLILNIGLIITGVLVNIKVKCPICHEVPFLPINDVELGVLGVASNIIIGILAYFTKNKLSSYIMLLFSMFLSGFSTFLQIGRYILRGGYCPYCLSSTCIFYILFGIFLYNTVIKPLLNNINTDLI